MQNKVQDGTRILYTHASSAENIVPGGTLVMIGDVAAVTSMDCAPGDTVAAEVCGVFSLPSDGAVIAQGASVYLASGKITATVGDVYVGKAWEAVASGGTFANVNINF